MPSLYCFTTRIFLLYTNNFVLERVLKLEQSYFKSKIDFSDSVSNMFLPHYVFYYIFYLLGGNFFFSIVLKLISLVMFSGIPQAENFSFSFHTMMSDAALKCEDYRDQV